MDYQSDEAESLLPQRMEGRAVEQHVTLATERPSDSKHKLSKCDPRK